MTDTRPWKTGEFEYEGFPLYLRVPDGLNYDELSKSYTQLIDVTQILSEVKSNGLPEADYNKTLIDFDGFLVNYLERLGKGITVLVETFGGKRSYYMYAKPEFEVFVLKQEINKLYTQHRVEIETNTDQSWSFIRQYANDWKF